MCVGVLIFIFFCFYLFEKLFFLLFLWTDTFVQISRNHDWIWAWTVLHFTSSQVLLFAVLHLPVWQSYMVILASFDVFIICFVGPPITFLGFPQVCCHLISYSCFYLQNSLQIFPTFTISSYNSSASQLYFSNNLVLNIPLPLPFPLPTHFTYQSQWFPSEVQQNTVSSYLIPSNGFQLLGVKLQLF